MRMATARAHDLGWLKAVRARELDSASRFIEAKP
jgi:hypothetical protein